ncbi:hypothetical protein DPF68_21770 [Salmonella enterica subsp. enterica serovar Typhimurium]|uniref:Uncharacterized protein n=2 Tax=Enterobacteriaceae TaxID=543 RepID=A0A5W2GXE6_SALTM|nr:hypothetical protein [Salmonella enterica subsp. enterica serovar Typhimurium]EEJ3362174.1 hypothetical protein [Salmonella enterica subsp. enterica serovar Hadar]EIW7081773.1 hypothetical protein [Salmonella enterica subsp. enterica serovar Newport]QQO88689.1 hypothetical protein JOLCFIKJ_00026 [Salmonella phage vB_SenS_BPS1]WDS51036.1 thymidylate synthase complementing protein [Salmonella phage SeF2]
MADKKLRFGHLETGDMTLERNSIRIGYSPEVTFAVKRRVERTTLTQVIVGNTRYRKDDGRAIGEAGCLFTEDDIGEGKTVNIEIVTEAEFREIRSLFYEFKEGVLAACAGYEITATDLAVLFRDREVREGLVARWRKTKETIADLHKQTRDFMVEKGHGDRLEHARKRKS